MYWTVLKSWGRSIYVDIPCRLEQPDTYEPKVMVEEAYRLSNEDIQFFYQNGYLGPFTLMSEGEATMIQEHLQQLLATESQVYPYSQGAYEIAAQDQDSASNGVRSNYDTSFHAMNNRDRHLEDSRLLDVFLHPALTERCAQLLGPDLQLWRTQFFPKAPGEAGTPIHQASCYLHDDLRAPVVHPPDCNELFQLTCWIALTEATQANGCMTVIKGSHGNIHPLKISQDFDPKSDMEGGKRFGTVKIEVDYPICQEDITPIEMKAGQFFIFSERVLHGSLGNQTDRWRWAVNGRIIRPNTYVYSERMLNMGHSYKIVGVNQISLDHWQAVQIRGTDDFGYNRLFSPPSVRQKLLSYRH
jgi:chlorinating enzyme